MATEQISYTPAAVAQTDERERILRAMSVFAEQRPGLKWGNYGDARAYRSESRSITRDLHDARQLLAAVGWRSSIGAEQLRAAFRAFSGRLSWDGTALRYCTGQYFPTEYRRAVCAVLASALWDYARGTMPEPSRYRAESWGNYANGSREVERGPLRATAEAAAADLAERGGQDWGHVQDLYDGLTAGDWLRRWARREFGARIARRWFD